MDRARYDRLTILFHWVMAALIFYAAAAILIADDLPRGAFRDLIKTSHNSVGAVVLVLLVLRVLWRLVSTAPALPSAMTAQQQRLARASWALRYDGSRAAAWIGDTFPARAGARIRLLQYRLTARRQSHPVAQHQGSARIGGLWVARAGCLSHRRRALASIHQARWVDGADEFEAPFASRSNALSRAINAGISRSGIIFGPSEGA